MGVRFAAAHLDRPDDGQCRDVSDGHRPGSLPDCPGVGDSVVPAAAFEFGVGEDGGDAHVPQGQVVVFGVAQPFRDDGVGAIEPVVVHENGCEVRVSPPAEVAEAVRQRHVQRLLEVGNAGVDVAVVALGPADGVERVRLRVGVADQMRDLDCAAQGHDGLVRVASVHLERARAREGATQLDGRSVGFEYRDGLGGVLDGCFALPEVPGRCTRGRRVRRRP